MRGAWAAVGGGVSDMNTATTTLDLTPFLATGESRYSLTSPFVRLGHRYFTDGRVCVRVPAPGETDADVHDAFKSANEVFPVSDPGDWKPWPDDGWVDGEIQCLACKGIGLVNTRKCITCDGTGETTCDYCHKSDECEDCWGDGYTGGTKCKACGGKCWVSGREKQLIGGVPFNAEFVQKILALPNVQYSPSSVQKSKPIAFKFDGGEGMLMPLNH
jgi:hypothetical protein